MTYIMQETTIFDPVNLRRLQIEFSSTTPKPADQLGSDYKAYTVWLPEARYRMWNKGHCTDILQFRSRLRHSTCMDVHI